MGSKHALAVVAVLAVGLVACEPTTSPTTTVPLLDPPDAFGPSPSVTTTDPLASPSVDNPAGVHRGTLPNGSDFVAHVPDLVAEKPALVSGSFLFDPGGGDLVPAGSVRYQSLSSPPPAEYGGGLLRLSTANWLVEIFFSPDVVGEFGPLAEEVITRSVLLEERSGWPVVHLAGPFTWGYAGADPPTVDFGNFVVTAGCSAAAVSCNETGAVQLIPIGAESVAATNVEGSDIQVESPASRSPYDPSYLDPGPLDERHRADLIWTGTELVVWGGSTVPGDIGSFTDGAAFDPETGLWRPLAPAPLPSESPSRAIWVGDEMVVVSPDGTFGYDPTSDSWRTVGNGLVPPFWPGRIAHAGGRIYVWSASQTINVLDLDGVTWSSIPSPTEGLDAASHFQGVLHAAGDEMIAVTRVGTCQGRRFHRLIGDGWQSLPDASLATEEYADCATANQSGFIGNDLVIWDDWKHPTMAYSPWRNDWRELPPIPLDGTEGASGAVLMGDQHFMVPRWGEGAIFDASRAEPIGSIDDWTLIDLPGGGTDAEIIWTGTELLAWGIQGTFDAWRWSPPEEVLVGGGDDAR